MKNTFPSYYKNFRCIADKCPDTCCAGWEIVVDSESAEKYNSAGGEIGGKLRKSMAVDADGDTVFVSQNRRCPFLLSNNLCEIYIEFGEKALCRTCTLFPRHITDLGSRKETGISISCPEAARLIFSSSEPITFETEEENTPIQPNNIDPTLYFTLIGAQKTAINILQNRKFSTAKRLIAFCRYCEEIQQNIKHGECNNISVTEEYFDFVNPSHTRKKRALGKYFSLLQSLEKLDAQWISELEKAKSAGSNMVSEFAESVSDSEWETEHLAVYFAFRYFMTAAFDGDILSKAKFTVFSVIMCRLLEASLSDFTDKHARIEAMRRYSKEVEHSAENMSAVFETIKKSRYFSSENLINILSDENKEN